MEYTRINEHIHRMVIPYKDIFTTVYTVEYDGGAILVDAATYETDITDYIVPMLDELKITKEKLKYVFITHNHGDHAGGVRYLIERYPDTVIFSRSPSLREKLPELNIRSWEDGESIAKHFDLIAIPGHSPDSSAIYDRRTKTLITGDSFQLYGIFGSQDWGSNIGLPAEHISAVDKVSKMDIDSIYAAHNFHPYGYAFIGKDAVRSALAACTEPLFNMAALIRKNPSATDAEIREMYNASAKIPPVREAVFARVREAIENGKM